MFTKNVYLDKKLSIIIDYIKSVKGIEYVKPLNNNEKKTILNLEEETMKKSALRPGVDIGVREAIARPFTLAAITNNLLKNFLNTI
jgi:hypothetical protein